MHQNAPKRHLVVVLSVLCGCTPTACLTNLMPQCPIPENSVRTPTPNSNTASSNASGATGSNGMYHLKGLERFEEDAIHITQMPCGNCGFENVNFGGMNYTFGLNIDL